MMKVLWISIMLVCLAACGAPESFETVTDQVEVLPPALKMQPVADLPGETVQAVFGAEDDFKMYFCGDYTLSMETCPAGDLNQTVLQTTGFSLDQLQLMETEYSGIRRYNAVWSAVGEGTDQVGRLCILDDGNYHYVLSAVANAEDAGDLSSGQWQQVFASFRLLSPEESVNTGS